MIFKKKFKYQGMVQFDENHEPCICGISVKWLDDITVKATTEKKAIAIADNLINEKYPQYNGMVQLW